MKSAGLYRALARQALSCSIPGGRQVPPSCGGWGNTYLERQSALCWDRPGRRLPAHLLNSTLKVSLHSAQGLRDRRCQGRLSLRTAVCTGKNSRRPTTIEMESEPTCDSIFTQGELHKTKRQTHNCYNHHLKRNTNSALLNVLKVSRDKPELGLRLLRKAALAPCCPLMAAGKKAVS